MTAAAPRDELLRPKDVEAEYGIKTGTLTSWRATWTASGDRVGPAWFRTGQRCVTYRRSSVEAYIAQQEATTGSAVA